MRPPGNRSLCAEAQQLLMEPMDAASRENEAPLPPSTLLGHNIGFVLPHANSGKGRTATYSIRHSRHERTRIRPLKRHRSRVQRSK